MTSVRPGVADVRSTVQELPLVMVQDGALSEPGPLTIETLHTVLAGGSTKVLESVFTWIVQVKV